MPLILAIEPDRRQAAEVKNVVAGQLQAELVLTESAARGLELLGARVPDLILASPLVSRQDERALADWLCDLGAASAHVQTLTIPILAAPARTPHRTRGLLSAFRGRQAPAPTAPDGCDPAVFAREVQLYLERAERERQDPEPIDVALPEPADVAASEPVDVPAPEPLDAVPPPGEDLAPEPVLSIVTVEPEEADIAFATAPVLLHDDPCLPEPSEEMPEPAPPPPPTVSRRRKPKVVQDEWGFFDPDQCGFAALIARLEEVTAQEADGEDVWSVRR